MVPSHHRILLYNRKEKTDTTTEMDLKGIMLSKKKKKTIRKGHI